MTHAIACQSRTIRLLFISVSAHPIRKVSLDLAHKLGAMPAVGDREAMDIPDELDSLLRQYHQQP